ncbi:YqjF family protein [Gelidibacter gilvus]|uniref:DUF2071 domain-containing protein n=1 Tax=Gelidibacter gilvus TaxID=59602 RepID=A0A4Q0XBP9_9FLAO|nr:DUF2071 domain-containing protein [Gelidibacter gilvus]RXJ44607.1 DUF2071 domain-containing protein [Gelidibacter gilvus]
MTIRELIDTTEHRPWKMPAQPWKFYQEWNNAIFLNWQVDLNDLKDFVPHELEIDLFEGKPWISVVAFTMEKIRPKNLPSFPPISDFDEINIRTYVKSNHKTGVYFLSMEGGKKLSCKVAKSISQLPYRFSKINRTENRYISTNTHFNDTLDIQFSIGNAITKKTALEIWLTERYALFQDTEKSINEFEIHHLEWPINTIELKKLEINYPRFNQLIKGKPHSIQYSKGVKVIAWGKLATPKTDYKT